MATVHKWRQTVEVGLLLRRHFRAACDTLGIPYTEHKGLIESTFVVTVTDDQWARLARWWNNAVEE